jgi:hypothetical protein
LVLVPPVEVVAVSVAGEEAGFFEDAGLLFGDADGHITDPMLRRLGVTKQQAGVLEDAGFLTRNGDGYHLHGWDQHQGKLRDRREKEAARQRALRASKNT